MGISDQGLAPETDVRSDRLDSWKEIALYLKRDVRTVQRWEKKEGLPVHRLAHEKQGTVYAYKSELDAWWKASEQKIAVEPPEPAEGEEDTEEFVLFNEEDEQLPILRRRWFQAFIAIALVAAVGAGIWWARRRQAAAHAKIRVLVLPLDNLSGDPQQAYFSAGMTEEITADLARLNPTELGVIARKTAEHYPGKPIDQIRKELKVDYVVEGSVLRDGGRVRVTVELIRADDQTHIWANTYDGELQDVLGMQSEVAHAIAREVSVRTDPLHQAKKVDPAAYDSFLRGRYFWNKRGVESLQKAMFYFGLAVKQDPQYAPAHAGLADGLVLLGSAQTGALPPDVAFPKAQAEAMRAMALDDSLAEPHATLAYIALVYDRDPKHAEQEFKRAIALDPHYATAHQWYGLYLISQNRLPEAIDSINEALADDPLSLPINLSLAEAYYLNRDYIHAVVQARKALELDGNSALGHFNLGRLYEIQGRYDDAISEFEQARLNSPNAAPLVPLAHAYAVSGNREAAKEKIAELQQLSKTEYVPAIYFALIYAGLNDRDQAFRWLDKAYDEHCDYLVFLERDPMADPLRSDPRFAKLREKIATKRQ